MSQFHYPYPFTWDPTPLQQGSPTVVNRGRNEIGSRDFFLSGNRTQPSSASIMSSFGMDIGVPSDASGRPLSGGPLRLLATPTFDYEGFFYTGGVFCVGAHQRRRPVVSRGVRRARRLRPRDRWATVSDPP